MIRPNGIPAALWAQLDGRLWHATSRTGLSGIIADGAMRTAVYNGSFCGSQNGVCLFDFGTTAENVDTRFEQSYGWFGRQQCSLIAIWLEIDRTKVSPQLWDAGQAWSKWREPMTAYGQFIHGVEACHIGPLPFIFVVGTLLIARYDLNLFRRCVGDVGEEVAAFELKLPTPPENSLVERLQAGRERALQKNQHAKRDQ